MGAILSAMVLTLLRDDGAPVSPRTVGDLRGRLEALSQHRLPPPRLAAHDGDRTRGQS